MYVVLEQVLLDGLESGGRAQLVIAQSSDVIVEYEALLDELNLASAVRSRSEKSGSESSINHRHQSTKKRRQKLALKS